MSGFTWREYEKIEKESTPEETYNNLIKYINSNFFIIDDGTYIVRYEGKLLSYIEKDIKNVYFKRMEKFISDYFFTKKRDIRTKVTSIGKPFLYDNKINFSPSIKWEHNKKYEEYEDEIKNKVNIMLDFIKNIICSNDEEQYNFLLKWIANLLKGNKNDSCLYLRGEEGIGKSSFTDFLMFYVVGRGLSLCAGSKPLKGSFNKEFEGKLLITFEELENLSKGEWNNISSVLKRYITGTTIIIEEKNKTPIEFENKISFIVNSNFDVIDAGRRYFELDVSHEKYQNTEYFSYLKNNCFNDVIGEAFFIYLMDNVDLTGYYAQNYPMSKNKLRSISKRLDNIYKYIKDEYILKNKDLNIYYKDLYENYKSYCIEEGYHSYSKQEFKYKLEIVEIKTYRTGGVLKYKISLEDLKKIADKRRWLHESDEEIKEEKEEIKNDEDLLRIEINNLKKEFEEYKINKENEINNLNEIIKNTPVLSCEEFINIKNKFGFVLKELIKSYDNKIIECNETKEEIEILDFNNYSDYDILDYLIDNARETYEFEEDFKDVEIIKCIDTIIGLYINNVHKNKYDDTEDEIVDSFHNIVRKLNILLTTHEINDYEYINLLINYRENLIYYNHIKIEIKRIEEKYRYEYSLNDDKDDQYYEYKNEVERLIKSLGYIQNQINIFNDKYNFIFIEEWSDGSISYLDKKQDEDEEEIKAKNDLCDALQLSYSVKKKDNFIYNIYETLINFIEETNNIKKLLNNKQSWEKYNEEEENIPSIDLEDLNKHMLGLDNFFIDEVNKEEEERKRKEIRKLPFEEQLKIEGERLQKIKQDKEDKFKTSSIFEGIY